MSTNLRLYKHGIGVTLTQKIMGASDERLNKLVLLAKKGDINARQKIQFSVQDIVLSFLVNYSEIPTNKLYELTRKGIDNAIDSYLPNYDVTFRNVVLTYVENEILRYISESEEKISIK